jgi:hypothetical protein
MAWSNEKSDNRFARYDSLSSSELRELLRQDSLLSEGEGLDGETALYIADLLSGRADFAAPADADAAWASFRSDYLPGADGKSLYDFDDEPKVLGEHGIRAGHPRARKKLLRFVEIAAIIAALFVVTAAALNTNPFHMVVRWMGDAVQIYSDPSGKNEIPVNDSEQYSSLRNALDKNNAADIPCPTWVPEDFSLVKVSANRAETMMEYSAYYSSARGDLYVRILKSDESGAYSIETDSGGKTVNIDGKDYNIFTNAEYEKAFWVGSGYSCSITGQITEDELIQIIKSLR